MLDLFGDVGHHALSMAFWKKDNNSVLLSGFESETNYANRKPDWESDAVSVDAALIAAVEWVGGTDRQVEVIELRCRAGHVVAVTAAGVERIEG